MHAGFNKLVVFSGLLASALVYAEAPERYDAKESGYNLELLTPYGNRVLYGSFTLDDVKDYQLEIPLEVLKPSTAAPAPSPQPPQIVTLPDPKEEKAKKKKSKDEDESEDRPPKKVEALPPAPVPTPAPTKPQVVVEYDDSDRFVVEANRLFNRGKYYDASLIIEELLRRKPDHVRGWIMKGSLMHVMGHKDLAQTAWKTAQKLEPQSREIKDILARYK